MPARRERGRRRQAGHCGIARFDEARGCTASLAGLLHLGKTIEFSDKTIPILDSTFGEVVDEGFDHIAAGRSQFFGSTELSGIAFHEIGVELVLADQQAETIAKPRLAIARTVPIRG